jgi:transcriptional regulator with XRE-family HTH domain
VPLSKVPQAEDLFRVLLRNLRETRNLTQAEVARRLGSPQSYVSKYETGERRLDFVETVFVCEALGISIEDFVKAFSAKLAERGRKKRD